MCLCEEVVPKSSQLIFSMKDKALYNVERTRVQSLSQLLVDERPVVLTGPRFDQEKG